MGQIVPPAEEHSLRGLIRARDPVLDAVAQAGRERGLSLVDAEVGALLGVLATAIGARRILEIGTALGYSGLWLARTLPGDGMLLTMEKDAECARVARTNFERAGLTSRVSVIVGDAALMMAKVSGPFDLIFQDASMPLYLSLLNRLVALLRPGGLLVTNNVLGNRPVVLGVIDSPHDADDTGAVALYHERLNAHPQLLTSTVPLRDGIALSVKRA